MSTPDPQHPDAADDQPQTAEDTPAEALLAEAEARAEQHRVDDEPYLRQLALTNLALAQEQSGAAGEARATAAQASELDGPYRVEALLAYARLSEAAGDAAAAEGAYRKVLAENPDPETRTLVQRRLPAEEKPPAG